MLWSSNHTYCRHGDYTFNAVPFVVCMYLCPFEFVWCTCLCVCVCVHTAHSLASPCLGENISSGLAPLPMTSGEAIIFWINDEAECAMAEIERVPRRITTDYEQQQLSLSPPTSASEQWPGHSQPNISFSPSARDGADNLCFWGDYPDWTSQSLQASKPRHSSAPFFFFIF